MARRKSVPYLKEKLSLLLRHDPVITTRSDLARELKTDPSAISKWQSGGDYPEYANRIPVHHFNRIMQLFNVNEDWLESAESPEENHPDYSPRLETMLRSRKSRPGWQNLFLDTEISGLLAIERSNERRLVPGSFRSLVFEGSPSDFLGECFFTDERVFVDLSVATPWQAAAAEAIAHLVLFVIDSSAITCLCPSAGFSVTPKITQSRIKIPEDSEKALRVTLPLGVQSLFAILTKDPLPVELYSELMRFDHPDVTDVLERVTVELRTRVITDWICLKQHYYVMQRG